MPLQSAPSPGAAQPDVSPARCSSSAIFHIRPLATGTRRPLCNHLLKASPLEKAPYEARHEGTRGWVRIIEGQIESDDGFQHLREVAPDRSSEWFPSKTEWALLGISS